MRDDFSDNPFSDYQPSGYPFPKHQAAEPLSGTRPVDGLPLGSTPGSPCPSPVWSATETSAAPHTAPSADQETISPLQLTVSAQRLEDTTPDVTSETPPGTLAQTPETGQSQSDWSASPPEIATPFPPVPLYVTTPAPPASALDGLSQAAFRPLWTVSVHKSLSSHHLGDEAGVIISTFTSPPPAWKHWLREGLSIGRDVLLALVIALLIGLFVIQPVYVKGTSMLPRLREGERLFVNRFIYNFSKIERGDIVVFYYPRNPQESFIKRVIGVPGDEITLAGGKLYINGKLVPEGYLSSDYTTIVSPPRTWVVEPHHYFVMGDNRDASNDSRNWGLVPEMYIYGKAVYRYWPVSEMGFIEDEATVLEPLRRLQRMDDRQELPAAE